MDEVKGADGDEAKRKLVVKEIKVDEVYYSRHNVELDVKPSPCCVIL